MEEAAGMPSQAGDEELPVQELPGEVPDEQEDDQHTEEEWQDWYRQFATQGDDPMWQADPWAGAVMRGQAGPAPGRSGSAAADRTPLRPQSPPYAPIFTTIGDPSRGPGPSRGSEPQKVVNDIPPTWNGTDPERRLEPYLKELEGWLCTTRTLSKQ